jgi:hypothetical protein
MQARLMGCKWNESHEIIVSADAGKIKAVVMVKTPQK